MSQYLNLFLRGKKDNYKGKILPFDSYSRNNELYRIFNDHIYVPYEKVTILTQEKVNELLSDVKEEINNYNKEKEGIKEFIKFLKPSEDYSEYLETIESKLSSIKEIDEELEDLAYTKSVLQVLDNIIFSDDCDVLFGVEAWFDENGILKEETDDVQN